MSPQALLGLLANEFERRRWRDSERAALRIVRAVEEAGGVIDPRALAKVPSRTFIAANRITRAKIEEACRTAFAGQRLAVSVPPLISIDEIESFTAASTVMPEDVADFVNPILPLLEEQVKDYINRIIGEPYADKDWGGEYSDIHTSRVILHKRRTPTAFLLKGRALSKKMTPKDLGLNGDQIERLSKQGVELYVVQHVGQVDEAVHHRLRDMILARRSEGSDQVVGSIWDGSDCARLFVAHGFIDPSTGEPLN